MKKVGVRKELSNSNIDQILSDTKIPIRLACIKSDGAPIIVSLWYICMDGKIYCATQKSAKIIYYLQNNPLCGFEIAPDKPPYKVVRVQGTAKILDAKGAEILNVLIDKYLGEKESTLSKFLKNNSKTETAIELTLQKVINYDYSKRMKDV